MEVEEVVPGSGSEAAGIQAGDVLRIQLQRGDRPLEVEARLARYGDRKEE